MSGPSAWVSDVRRHYGPEDMGPLCAAGCGTRIVRQLAAVGITEHPTCVRSVIRASARA